MKSGIRSVISGIALLIGISLIATTGRAIGLTIGESSVVKSEFFEAGVTQTDANDASDPSFPNPTEKYGSGAWGIANWSYENNPTRAVFSADAIEAVAVLMMSSGTNTANLTFTLTEGVNYSITGDVHGKGPATGGQSIVIRVFLEGPDGTIIDIKEEIFYDFQDYGRTIDLEELPASASDVTSGFLPAGEYTLRYSLGARVGGAEGGNEVKGSFSMILEAAPVIPVLEVLQPPQSYTAEPGSSATFTVLTGGIAGEIFEWKHGDTVVGGDTATLTLSNVQAADSGQYTVAITAGGESVSTRTVTLGVKAPPYTEKMMNISTRGQILEGSKIMIAGFVLDGSGQKDVLIRGIGPTLGQWVEGVCTDSKLALFRATNPATPSIAENEIWGSLSVDVPAICERVGAFALLDGSADAVLYMNLDPGAYTAKVSGLDGTGVGLVELYDADLDPLVSTCNLSNISTRGEVGTQAQILIAGFVIDGDVPKQVLVRGIGPRLADFDVDGTLIDPYLRITKNATPEALWAASNDNWSDNPNAADIITTSAAVGAFDLVDGSRDAVMLTWLEPGTYTAQVSGVDDGTGVALVEVYEVK